MNKLKPGTSYDFNEADLQFVLELAKVGHVHLLSNKYRSSPKGGTIKAPQ
jgi:hypothetical protein